MKKLVSILFRLGVGLLIVIVLLEAALLFFDGWIFRNAFWGFDPDLGMRVRPYAPYGKYRANRFGFNDQDYPLEAPAGTFRILVLSDSFNWAGGRIWNYVYLLKDSLKAKYGERVEVINAGYPATHTAEQLILLEKYGMQYRPDLVVLGFFAGNDFSEAQPWRRRIAYGGEAIDLDTRTQGYWLLFGKPVMWKSRFYVFMRAWWKGFKLKRGGGGMSREQFLKIERARMRFCDPARWEEYAPHVQLILDSLMRMRDLLTRNGKQFMVVAFPDEFQADGRLREEVAQSFRLDISSYQWNRPQSLLEDFCRREGIEYHDLLVPFQDATREGTTLYIRSDTHWNQAGNQLAARLLEGFLERSISAHRSESEP